MSKNKKSKCIKCEYYDKKTDKCTMNNYDNCSKTDFSKCEDFLIKEKLINF